MGQTLSEPVREKHTSSGADENHIYAVSCMQGWRISMEDAHTTVLQIGSSEQGKRLPSFFGVYDGHGGSNVAIYTGHHLHERLAREPLFTQGNYSKSLTKTFLGMDSDLREDPAYHKEPSGCTAVAAIVAPDNKIYVANAGDSRSVMGINGECKPLSFDHKPTNDGENSRIVAAGGYVEFGRVNGNLALSRAFGDFEFKKNSNLNAEAQIVTADPEITVHSPTDDDEFLILACDGIWDCLTSQQVVDFVRRGIVKGLELSKICEDLMEKCLAPISEFGGVGCDNMTVMIIGLLRGRSKEEWYQWIKSRVEAGQGHKMEDEPTLFRNAQEQARPDNGLARLIRMNGSGGLASMVYSPEEEEEEEVEEVEEVEEEVTEMQDGESAASGDDHSTLPISRLRELEQDGKRIAGGDKIDLGRGEADSGAAAAGGGATTGDVNQEKEAVDEKSGMSEPQAALRSVHPEGKTQ